MDNLKLFWKNLGKQTQCVWKGLLAWAVCKMHDLVLGYSIFKAKIIQKIPASPRFLHVWVNSPSLHHGRPSVVARKTQREKNHWGRVFPEPESPTQETKWGLTSQVKHVTATLIRQWSKSKLLLQILLPMSYLKCTTMSHLASYHPNFQPIPVWSHPRKLKDVKANGDFHIRLLMKTFHMVKKDRKNTSCPGRAGLNLMPLLRVAAPNIYKVRTKPRWYLGQIGSEHKSVVWSTNMANHLAISNHWTLWRATASWSAIACK